MFRKIYKFRKLTSEIDYYRLRDILGKGEFYCSSFWELNDPMEGVFTAETIKDIRKTAGLKSEYKICSFSGEKGFKNPAMWGYYAGGFKGVAIEVEYRVVKDSKIKEVDYLDDLPNNKSVKKVLLNKNTAWRHEDEYRFLDNSFVGNCKKIGRINTVYFGNPYSGLVNSNKIRKKDNSFAKYNKLKEKLIKLLKVKRIKYHDVVVKNGNVEKS